MPKAMLESMSFRFQDMSERKVLHFHFGKKNGWEARFTQRLL